MKQFFVKGIDDKTCTIDYDDNTYFEQVYLELEKRYCISRNYFWLRFHKPINPSILVSSIVYQGATIFMIGKSNPDIIKDIIILKGKSFTYPRDMLNESYLLKEYYQSLVPKNRRTQKTIKIENILSKDKLRIIGNSKEILASFDHYYTLFIYLFAQDRKPIPRPLNKNFGLKHIVNDKIIKYLGEIDIEDLKNFINFCNVLEIEYFFNYQFLIWLIMFIGKKIYHF